MNAWGGAARVPDALDGVGVAATLAALSLAALVLSSLSSGLVPVVPLLQLGVIAAAPVVDASMRARHGPTCGAAGLALLALSAAAWLVGASLMTLDRAVFLSTSLAGWFDDPTELLLLLGAALPLSVMIGRSRGAVPRPGRALRAIARVLAFVGLVLLVLASARSRHLPSPDDYIAAQPIVTEDATAHPHDDVVTAVVAACSYRVRSGPIRVRRDRVNGIYIIEPRLGWLGACAPTPGGGFRRIDVRLQQLRRAVSTPREWLVTAALGLLAFVCVRGDRRALEPLAAPGGGEVDPSTAAYRSAPRFLDGASLDGNTDEAVARLRARVEARDAWRLLIVLVSITPLVVACAAGFGLP